MTQQLDWFSGSFIASFVGSVAVASPCRQGATFPGAVLPAAVDSSGTVRVAGVASLQRCVAACCDSPGCDSAWLSKGRCYASSCQRGASCRPQASPGADSVSAFLQRAPPRSSSEWGEPYDGQEGGATESGRSQDTFNQSQREGPGGAEPGSNMTQNRRWSDGTEETAGTRKPEARPSATGSAPTNHTMMMSSPRDDISVTETPGEPVLLSSPAEPSEQNRAPVAVVGPDRLSVLPQSGSLLNGSGSSGSSYSWEVVSGPAGLRSRDADRAVAVATGLRGGRYTFRSTVSDQQGATDSASSSVRVQEASALPPVAHASGSHVSVSPNNSVVSKGSISDGDQSEVRYRWTRDGQSPAAGEVSFGSESGPSLYSSDSVEGTYSFRSTVTDGRGRSGSATATVEVRPEPGGEQQVESEMSVPVSQVSVAQKNSVVRQLAASIHVSDRDIRVRASQEQTRLSTVSRFCVQGPSGPASASSSVVSSRKQSSPDKSNFSLFKVSRIDTVACESSCSGRGQCDPITKQCSCDPFWTENSIRLYSGDGQSNCEWRVSYVISSSFSMMLSISSLSWTFVCCSRRRKRTKGRRKTRYTISDDMDEQERSESRPRFSSKHRSTEHNSSLMMSESESDSDSVLSRNRIGSRAARNGDAFR